MIQFSIDNILKELKKAPHRYPTLVEYHNTPGKLSILLLDPYMGNEEARELRAMLHIDERLKINEYSEELNTEAPIQVLSNTD